MASTVSSLKLHCGTTVFHRYKYDTVIQSFQNHSVSIAACMETQDVSETQTQPSMEGNKGKTLCYTLGSNGYLQTYIPLGVISTWWNALKYCPNIHGPDMLTFPLAPWMFFGKMSLFDALPWNLVQTCSLLRMNCSNSGWNFNYPILWLVTKYLQNQWHSHQPRCTFKNVAQCTLVELL